MNTLQAYIEVAIANRRAQLMHELTPQEVGRVVIETIEKGGWHLLSAIHYTERVPVGPDTLALSERYVHTYRGTIDGHEIKVNGSLHPANYARAKDDGDALKYMRMQLLEQFVYLLGRHLQPDLPWRGVQA